MVNQFLTFEWQSIDRQAIPTEIGLLSRLDTLTLDNNQLTGTIPNNKSSLTWHSYAHLCKNKLSGAVPSTLGYLTSEIGLLAQLHYLVLVGQSIKIDRYHYD